MSDFNFITTRLATGAAISGESDVAQLVSAGVTHVIDCRSEFDDGALLASHPQLTYLWNGTADDGKSKPLEWFARSLNFALSSLARPKVKVYAHCAAGVNRGPSTAFAIMLAQGWTPTDAETLMRTRRPQVGIAYKVDAIRAISALGYI